ncbi:MAG: FAD-dependent monooxygenase [Xanthomonadales bacterium]|nr:FAD-dependent monooxygenase [Xanthomonadales bacterium]
MSRRAAAVEILVVGGGLVGAAAALAAARLGREVLWLRPESGLVEGRDPGAIALAPAACALLAALGLGGALAEETQPVARMEVWDEGGRIVFDAAELGLAELARIAPPRRLHAALESAAGGAARVLAVTRLEPLAVESEERAIRLRLAGGESIAASLLLAADGAASPLRALLGVATAGRDYGAEALTFPVASERPHRATALQRFLPGGPIALLPRAGGLAQVVWSLPKPTARRLAESGEAALAAAAGKALEDRLGALRPAGAPVHFPLRLVLAERVAGPRFALLGDAAHQLHPLAGQGANLGLLDVAWLAAALARAARRGLDPGSPAALAPFARARLSEGWVMGLALDGLERLFAAESPLWPALRRAGVALCDRLPALKRWFARQASGWAAWPPEFPLPGGREGWS